MSANNSASVETAPREVIISRTISAPRELVFDAFTKAEHLSKWFGPRIFRVECETDPIPGGKYRLAMIGLDNAPAEYRGPYPMKGEYLEVVRPERLVYTTDLSEHPQAWKDLLKASITNGDKEDFLNSVVTITFEDQSGATKLTIHTRFSSDAVRDGYVKLQMGAGWSESLDKLEEFLATNTTGTVIVERTYDAPIERVWDAISNNDQMKKWYFALADFRPEIGFEFEFSGGPPEHQYVHECKVVEVIPRKKLTYTWRYRGHQGNSTVTFDLSSNGDGTTVRLTHSGLDSFIANNNHDFDASNFAEGWNHILGTSLKEFLEASS